MNARANHSSSLDGIRIYGLTGSIGSGKSAAAHIFERLGAVILDADVLARQVVEPGNPALNEILSTFGKGVLQPDGTLNRKRLGEIVFSDSGEREKLEAIVHPRIRELFLEALGPAAELARKRGEPLIYVVPLLYESRNVYPEIQKVIVVWAPEEVCIERVIQRDGCSRDLALKKLHAQISPDEKKRRADIVIENDSDLANLETEVQTVFDLL